VVISLLGHHDIKTLKFARQMSRIQIVDKSTSNDFVQIQAFTADMALTACL